MTLYEIDSAILNALERATEAVDSETGEIIEDGWLDALNALQAARDDKIENIALYIKNLDAEAGAIREEEKALAWRRRSKENKAERLKEYLNYVLEGNKFETARVNCSYRKSNAVEIDDTYNAVKFFEENGFDQCIKYKDPDIVKSEVAKIIKRGVTIPGAKLVERSNLNIK